MKDLNIQIAIKIYEYEELNAADRELLEAARQALALAPEDGRIRDNVAFLAG